MFSSDFTSVTLTSCCCRLRLVSAQGFEPRNAGFRDRCLKPAWRRRIIDTIVLWGTVPCYDGGVEPAVTNVVWVKTLWIADLSFWYCWVDSNHRPLSYKGSATDRLSYNSIKFGDGVRCRAPYRSSRYQLFSGQCSEPSELLRHYSGGLREDVIS